MSGKEGPSFSRYERSASIAMHATSKTKQKNNDKHCVTVDDFKFCTEKTKCKMGVFVNNNKKIRMRAGHYAS